MNKITLTLRQVVALTFTLDFVLACVGAALLAKLGASATTTVWAALLGSGAASFAASGWLLASCVRRKVGAEPAYAIWVAGKIASVSAPTEI